MWWGGDGWVGEEEEEEEVMLLKLQEPDFENLAKCCCSIPPPPPHGLNRRQNISLVRILIVASITESYIPFTASIALLLLLIYLRSPDFGLEQAR